MADALQLIFEGRPVRLLELDGAPWWVGRDVCVALEVVNTAQALDRLESDERRDGVCITDRLGREQSVVAISEPGLYRLIFASRKPAAERFKRWLAHEVLPSLRRTGEYSIAPQADLPPDTDYWLSLVREARRTYGRAAAARVWEASPLPHPLAGAPSGGGGLERLCLDFIAECCAVTGSDWDFLSGGKLRDAARQYCRDAGLAFPGPRSFANAFLAVVRSERHGLGRDVVPVKRSTTGYKGLRLL